MTYAFIVALAGILGSLAGVEPAVTQTELPPPGQSAAPRQTGPASSAAPAQEAPKAAAPQAELAPVAPPPGIKTNEEPGPGRRVAAFWFIVPPRS